MHTFRIILFAISLLSGLSVPVVGQDLIYSIKNYGVEDGLVHREVNAIFQDRDGFIWAASLFGLNRFDGYEFRTWTSENSGHSFENIRTIVQDSEDWLWLAAADLVGIPEFDRMDGLLLLHPHTEEVVEAEKVWGETPFRLADLNHYIAADATGNVYLFSLEKPVFYRYHHQTGFEEISIAIDLDAYQIRCRTADGMFWATGDGLLFCFNASGEVIHQYQQSNVFELAPGIDGEMWGMVTSAGQQKKYFRISHAGTLEYVTSEGLFGEAVSGSEWIFSDSLQILLYNADSDILFVPVREGDLQVEKAISLGIKSQRAALKQGASVWIGHDFGLSRIDFRENRFVRLPDDVEGRHLNNNKGRGSRLSTRGILALPDRLLAVGEFFGLLEVARDSADTWNANRLDIPGFTMGSTINKALVLGPDSILYLGNAYLGRADPNLLNTEIIHYAQSGFRSAIWDIYFLPDGRALLGTYEGLALYDPQAEFLLNWRKYNNFRELGKTTILHIGEDRSGQIWLCAGSGFYEFHPDVGITARYSRRDTGKYYLPYSDVQHFHQDAAGIYWLATGGGGLVRWDREAGSFEQFTRSSGLSNNNIYAVYEDGSGKLWLSSDYGIMRFDKETHLVNTYLPKDGTADFEFNRISHLQTEEGWILFGGLNGITVFHPDDFGDQLIRKDPPLVITSFLQYDKATQGLQDRRGDLLRDSAILLRPGDDFFQIDFSLLSFDGPDQIRYAYLLEGIDEDWHYQQANTLRLSRLPYGNTTLRIRGQEANGNWSPHELRIPVTVMKPVYLRIWFLIALVGLIILLVVIWIRWRTRSLQIKKQRLEWEVARVTRQIVIDKATIEKQAEELRDLDRIKSRFFANVSHELRTPLTLVLGPLQSLLKKKRGSDRESQLLRIANHNGKALLRLVNEILDFSKLEAGRMSIEEKVIGFTSFLDQIVTAFREQAELQGVKFGVANTAASDLTLEMDARKYEIILNNLLSNALKCTPKGGEVVVRVEESADRLLTFVRDNGRGIHPDDLPRIFDRYYQSSRSEVPTEGGTGIGLSLSREYARLMGGELSVESEWQTGSTFCLEIPLKKKNQPGAGRQPNPAGERLAVNNSSRSVAAPTEETNRPLLLIVEDNFQMQEYLELILGGHYQTITAANGRLALELLEDRRQAERPLPDLIISDIMMPEMDGFQLLARLKAEPGLRIIPVIMLTARADIRDKLNALRIGVDDYLLKPFREEELLVRVANLLSNFRERRQSWNSRLSGVTTSASTELPAESLDWLAKLERTVRENIQEDNLTLEGVGELLYMSRRNLSRRIKELTGITANSYIREVRLQEARQLLESRRAQTVKEVCQRVGFKDPVYFSRIFQERFGKRPSEFLPD